MEPMHDAATTTTLSLDAGLTRIARHELVAGILLLGSTGTEALTATSDYDVLLVFSSLPAPLRIVNTWIDGRLAEIYCTTTAAIERIVSADTPWPDSSEEATVLGWLQTGRIHADPHGNLSAAQSRAAAAPTPTLPGDDVIYEAWRKIGYNVAQIQRYLVADDPLSQTAIDLRLLYSVDEVKVHYFTVRRLAWRGEKLAIRYWMDHDSDFLECLRQYFDTYDRPRKVGLYEELARMALTPIGELWTFGQTVVSLGDGYGTGLRCSEGLPMNAIAFWKELVDHTDA